MAGRRQFILFVLSGGLAAGVNWLSRILYSLIVNLDVAIVLAHLTGMIVAFVVMRARVFTGQKGRGPQEFLRFGLVNVVSLTQTWAVTLALLALAPQTLLDPDLAEALAHGLGIASTLPTSFYLHRSFTFPRTLG